jgi:hypothetical protein
MNRSPFSSLRLREKGRKKQSGLALDALQQLREGGGENEFSTPTKKRTDLEDLRRGSLDCSPNPSSPLSARSSRRRPSQLIGLFSPPDIQVTSSPLRHDQLDHSETQEGKAEKQEEEMSQKENERNPLGSGTPGSVSMRKKDLKRKASEVFGTPTKTMMTAIQTSTMQVSLLQVAKDRS